MPDTARAARRNRLVLLLLVASFVLPFVVGDLAYRLGWYEGGRTNRGQLIDPPVALATLGLRDLQGATLPAAFTQRQWWLLYILPADCDATCRNRLYQMRQVPKALGRESDRLQQAVIVTGPLAPETEALLQREFADFLRLRGEPGAMDAALRGVVPVATVAGQLYVMDPMGWIMLAYAPEADEKRSVEKAEDVLIDLRKLLKASRIG